MRIYLSQRTVSRSASMWYPGKIYSWCSCGLTATTPFCDNAHRDIEDEPYRSIKVQFDKAETVWFCQCKHTKTPPFCDNTHLTLK
jgi:CDGSH-type Zn-finger protein